MLKLYTDRKSFKSNEILSDNDAVFDVHTSRSQLNEVDKELMMKYDGARVIGENEYFGLTIQTRYGITHIGNLSTSLKTMLNLRHMKAMPQYMAIDVTSAGGNVLMDIFQSAMELNVPIILGHTDIPVFTPIQMQVDNGEVVTDVSRLQEIIWSKGEAQ